MSPLGPGDEAAIREVVLRELRGSDLAVLVRQLQGLTGGLVVVVAQAAGGLPLNGTFALPRAGDWTFLGFGSGYVTVASTLLRIGFGIDTTSTEADARQFVNETFSHRALTPAIWTRTGLAAGNHTYNVHIDSTSTIVNSDDYFSIVAFMAP